MNRSVGCCSNTHAKNFEIILIVGFFFAISILIINLIFTLWCFKLSYPLFIIEIGMLAFNALGFILSIILRIWRNNGSVINANFSSSISVSFFLLVLVIISLLSSIAEEVLFSFVSSYLSIFYKILDILMGDSDENEGELEDLANEFEKKEKILKKIMKKNFDEKLFSFLDEDDDDEDEDNNFEDRVDKVKNKITILNILSWISINFNIFIQFLFLIFIPILISRIKLRSDFGYPIIETSIQSNQNRMLGQANNNVGILTNDINNINNNNIIGQKKKRNSKKLKGEQAYSLKSEQIKIAKSKKKKIKH